MFIADVRNCTTKDAEERRVIKELAKLREKLGSGRRGMSVLDKKKYVWKLLYCYMLGYEVDFGHAESVTLINSSRLTEKYTGYIAATLLLNADSPALETVVGAIRNDLMSGDEVVQSLALAMVGNIGGPLLTSELSGDVLRLIASEYLRLSDHISKKALACLTRLFRHDHSLLTPEVWVSKFYNYLESRSIGLQLACASLVLLAIREHDASLYEVIVPLVIHNLTRLVLLREVPKDYLYYNTPCPWLQVKLLKILQHLPAPSDASILAELSENLERIMTRTEVTKSINKNNADHAILFEAINVIIHYHKIVSPSLKSQCVDLLGKFISVKEANIRYFGLETMAKLADKSDGAQMLVKHQSAILYSLRDSDVSIRKRALEVLFCMCGEGNAVTIVEQLLDFLPEADYNIKEDLVVKTAVLAEKYGKDLTWYLDVVVQLITHAGDYVSDDIWCRVVQVIAGFGTEVNVPLQTYAASKAFLALLAGHVHENLVRLGGYLVSEFAQRIFEQPGKSPAAIFEVLNKHFPFVSDSTKAMLLHAYMKLVTQFEDLRDLVIPVFEQHAYYWDPEVQQRALEYLRLTSVVAPETAQACFEVMPTYSQDLKQKSLVLKQIVSMQETVPQVKETAPQVKETAPQLKESAEVNLLDI
jgi:AP-2 complex subunit alpha